MRAHDAAAPAPLILASASPRRRHLLGEAGFSFEVAPADIDETVAEGEDALHATVRIALEKGRAGAERAGRAAIVLAADTSVVCEGRMFGKPADEVDAVRSLLALSGRNHVVYTAWAILEAGETGELGACLSGVTATIVRMCEISTAAARAYVAGGEPMDKAGAYAVQGEGRRFVAAVLGDLSNVIGLPVGQVARALSAFGVAPTRSR